MTTLAPTTPTPIPLSQLPRGSVGRVHERSMCCEDCELLNAMGLTDQCTLRVCRAGATCIVDVKSTRLGLSAEVARRIMMIPEPFGD